MGAQTSHVEPLASLSTAPPAASPAVPPAAPSNSSALPNKRVQYHWMTADGHKWPLMAADGR